MSIRLCSAGVEELSRVRPRELPELVEVDSSGRDVAGVARIQAFPVRELLVERGEAHVTDVAVLHDLDLPVGRIVEVGRSVARPARPQTLHGVRGDGAGDVGAQRGVDVVRAWDYGEAVEIELPRASQVADASAFRG